MKVLAMVALLTLVGLAGCSSNDNGPATHTCRDGGVVDLGPEPRAEGFNPETICYERVPPTVRLGASSYTVGVYRTLSIGWTVENGTVPEGHTMLTSIRLSHHSMAVDNLTGPDGYGVKELLRVEHQNLPGSFNLTTAADDFSDATLVGTRYLRAYATIQGEGVHAKDFWSDEIAINITGVQPTGTTHTIVHGPGGFQGRLTPAAVSAKLGDAIVFQNADVVSHLFTQISKPACAAQASATMLQAGVPAPTTGPSPPLLLMCPGEYVFETDDAPTKLTVAITASLD